MVISTQRVVDRAADVTATTREGAAWLAANSERLSLDTATLGRSFRKFARRAQRLCAAAERPTGVAVFGASQAGKSYLVSSLATSRDRPLTAVYGGERLNFLRDLNPQGGKESTGLVSRFTMRTVATPRDSPVPLRLLSQTDVVKILANAFLEDFRLDDLHPPEQKEISDLFKRLSAEAAPTPQASMSADDIEDLQDYFERHFRSHAMFQALVSGGYWATAVDLIPRLPPRLRAEAYAPLWNGTAAFTKIAATLIGALEKLGFPENAFCAIDALMPRETGILNVDTVFALGTVGNTTVRAISDGGRAVDLDRPVLAALVAEITVPMADKPWDFFDHTDLLDFPGARSREEIKKVDEFLAEPGKLGRVFLRGKVAYLWQRYNAEQEIAAMLLCVGPGNQDVQTLPDMVNGWIRDTIGPNPAARALQRNALFLVLTKFDEEFVEKIQGDDIASGQRWTARLQASLLDFFGKAHDWPKQWANGRPFTNTFWLRSTAIGFPALFDYEPAPGGAEAVRTEVWASRADGYVKPRHDAYVANESVRAHFADPERAWLEALTPNDGGIGYLAESLRPVCDPALKAEQISGRTEELAREVAAQLRPFFHSGDIAAEIARSRQSARTVQKALLGSAEIQMFGPLMRALMVSQNQMQGVYRQLQLQPGAGKIVIGRRAKKQDYNDELGLDLDDEDVTQSETSAQDIFDQLAQLAIEEWTRTIQGLAEDPSVETVFNIPREQIGVLGGALVRAARRLKLRQEIADTLRIRANFQQNGANSAEKPILVLEQTINRFVYMLGFDRLPAARRPELANRARRIFAPKPPVAGIPGLGPAQTAYERTFHVDWMTALARVFEDNVNDAESGAIDIKANEGLGVLLRRLEE
jgi:hypothetical protein